jgi:hypothetical protein
VAAVTDHRGEAERVAAVAAHELDTATELVLARIHATLALVDALDVIGAELGRVRVAVEVLAGEALDRGELILDAESLRAGRVKWGQE